MTPYIKGPSHPLRGHVGKEGLVTRALGTDALYTYRYGQKVLGDGRGARDDLRRTALKLTEKKKTRKLRVTCEAHLKMTGRPREVRRV